MSGRTPDEGRYSKVSRRMWNDEKFQALSAPKPNAQTLWKRLLTGPELGCIPGLFAAWDAGLARALKWPLPAFLKCFKEIVAQEMARADWDAGLVWVPNAIVHNEPTAPNTVIGWRQAIRELPECKLKHEAIAELRVYLEAMGPPWVRAFDMACTKPSTMPSPKSSAKASDNQEQEQEQEQDTERDARARGRPLISVDDELQDDWKPNAANVALSVKLGRDLDEELGLFRAWCKKSRRVSGAWDAEFEIWLRRSKQFERVRQRGRGRGPVQVDRSGLTGWEDANGTD